MTVRIAAIQYRFEPISTLQQFSDQVTRLLDQAAHHRPQFVLLPELFSAQLMCLIDETDPARQVRRLADYLDPYRDLLAGHARRHGYYLIGGSYPTLRDGRIYNTAYLFEPDGDIHAQDKIQLTPWEKDPWKLDPGDQVKVFQTDHEPIGILICYDVEFPEAPRLLAKAGAHILFVPSCTCDRAGYLRVRRCAQARAIEDQIYVAMTSTVGTLPIECMKDQYGRAGIFTPSDPVFLNGAAFEDAIAAQGRLNEEDIVVADLDFALLHDHRHNGAVTPLKDLAAHQPRPVACVIEARFDARLDTRTSP